MIRCDDIDVSRFRNLVLQRFGLHFDDDKRDGLARTLRSRAEACGSKPGAYLARLESQVEDAESRALAQELTITETSFFRHIEQFEAFRTEALPRCLAARAASRHLRILSAGCASGEEAYTLAMLIRDTPEAAGWTVTIRGIDINPAALRKAAAGRYSAWSLRQTPASFKSRMFRIEEKGSLLSPEVRAMVSFEERNLAREDPAFWSPGAFDIVFCRNVLMYFSPDAARAALRRIARSLEPGGFLFLGSAETLRGLSSDFTVRQSSGSFYYQHGSVPGVTRDQVADIPRYAPAQPEPSDDAWVDAIRGASERILSLASGRQTPRKRPTKPGLRHAATTPPSPLRRASDLLSRERFADAWEILNVLPEEVARTSEALLLKAVLLTHGGNLEAAEEIGLEILQREKGNAGAHYLIALCREAARDDRTAARHARTAALLDPSFAMPRLRLGVLARRAGDREGARRELRDALRLLRREEPARLHLFGGGFDRLALMNFCNAELASCGDAH